MATNKRDLPWVTASNIGKAAYCPYALYLAEKGVRPSREAVKAQASGTREHGRWAAARRGQGRSAAGTGIRILLIVLGGVLLIAAGGVVVAVLSGVGSRY